MKERKRNNQKGFNLKLLWIFSFTFGIDDESQLLHMHAHRMKQN